MLRSWSSPMGCFFLFSCLALLTVAAPVPAGATGQLTASSRFDLSLSDSSSRYLDGVGGQRGSTVTEWREGLAQSRQTTLAEARDHVEVVTGGASKADAPKRSTVPQATTPPEKGVRIKGTNTGARSIPSKNPQQTGPAPKRLTDPRVTTPQPRPLFREGLLYSK